MFETGFATHIHQVSTFCSVRLRTVIELFRDFIVNPVLLAASLTISSLSDEAILRKCPTTASRQEKQLEVKRARLTPPLLTNLASGISAGFP